MVQTPIVAELPMRRLPRRRPWADTGDKEWGDAGDKWSREGRTEDSETGGKTWGDYQKEGDGDTGCRKSKGEGGPEDGGNAGGLVGEGGSAGGGNAGDPEEGDLEEVGSGGGAKVRGGAGKGSDDGGKVGTVGSRGTVGKGGAGSKGGLVDVHDESLRRISSVVADVAKSVELSDDAKSATGFQFQGSGSRQL